MTEYRREVVRTSKGGEVGARKIVPRVPDDYLDAVVFLYASEDAANAQEDAGGTGFIVGVPWELADKKHFYFVSNRHVAKMGWPVVRLNTGSTGSDVVKLSGDNWQGHDKYDVAICPFEVDPKWSNMAAVAHDTLLTQSQQLTWGIGCGDDVFVVGRFVGYDGFSKNTPFLHTGVISRAPGVPMDNLETGQFEIGWTVELHSRGGYSGSPVFGYISPKQVQIGGRDRTKVGEVVYLLGILWAYLADSYSIEEWDGEEWNGEPPLDDEGNEIYQRVRVQNGLAGVVKAQELNTLLMSDDEKLRRKKVENDWVKNNTKKTSAV